MAFEFGHPKGYVMNAILPILILRLMVASGCGNDNPSSSASSDSETPSPLPPEPLSETLPLTVDELERRVILHIPPGTPASAPVVIVMHGYSSQAAAIASYSGFKELTDREKFIVAFPQGTSDSEGYPFFNVGYAFHDDVVVDDLGFVRHLVETLQSDYAASQEHVFATGMSNGADMSFYLACEASELFAAFAPVAGTMMKHIYDGCSPEFPRPIMAVNGTADDVTYYNGDPENRDGWGVYLDIPSIVEFWRGLSDLDQLEEEILEDVDSNDGSQVTRQRHFSSDHTREFLLYRVENGGHDWPGVWGNMNLMTTEEIWRFFSKVIDASSDSR